MTKSGQSRSYDGQFYQDQMEGSRASAQIIVPIVIDLVNPTSVVDVGCGVAAWLSVFEERGVKDIFGIDGDYVDRRLLHIPNDKFLVRELNAELQLPRRFDLSMSLEVGEHLEEKSASTFVSSLTSLAPVVLFSAAIPHQGGIHHLNEQWPDYWADRFEANGYVPVDCIRHRVWQNPKVRWWYAQNMLIFVSRDHLGKFPRLKAEAERTKRFQLSIVHPAKYFEALEQQRIYLALLDLATLIPAEAKLILADNNQWSAKNLLGDRFFHFLERDGEYYGTPADDATAIRELERLRRAGANFIAIGWPAFWWLDFYPEFHRHLSSRYRTMLQNDRLVVFDLRAEER